jgi:hypothetical protein
MGGLQRGLRGCSGPRQFGSLQDPDIATVAGKLEGLYRAAALRGRLAWDCTAG